MRPAKRDGTEIPRQSEKTQAARNTVEIGSQGRTGARERFLEARAGSSDVVSERRDIRSVGSHAARVNRQTQVLCLFDAEAGIVELRQAVALGRRQAVASRQVDRARRAMRVPALSNDIEELVPVSPIPHAVLPSADSVDWMQPNAFG